MWCLDDIRRDSRDWVGPPTWERARVNSLEWGGSSSPVKAEPLQIVFVAVVVLLFCCFVVLLLCFCVVVLLLLLC